MKEIVVPESEGDALLRNLYLIFHIGQEEYGIGIRNVTEIVGLQEVARIPDLPAYFKGVINLRGRVIPVVDARARFGFPGREYDGRTCSIVLEVGGVCFGLIVDMVDEVISFEPEEISTGILEGVFAGARRFVTGIGHKRGDDKVKLLLDAACLLGGDMSAESGVFCDVMSA